MLLYQYIEEFKMILKKFIIIVIVIVFIIVIAIVFIIVIIIVFIIIVKDGINCRTYPKIYQLIWDIILINLFNFNLYNVN
jgi:hypothetical protein